MQSWYDYLKQPCFYDYTMLTETVGWNIAMSFKRAAEASKEKQYFSVWLQQTACSYYFTIAFQKSNTLIVVTSIIVTVQIWSNNEKDYGKHF